MRLWISVLWLCGLAVPAAAAESETARCLDLVRLVTEELSADSSALALARGKLARAADLCEAGHTEEAEALLKKIQAEDMPMGMGN